MGVGSSILVVLRTHTSSNSLIVFPFSNLIQVDEALHMLIVVLAAGTDKHLQKSWLDTNGYPHIAP